MRIHTGLIQSLPDGLGSSLNNYRYQVFVKHLGWDLKTPEGVELDQFDRPDTVYVVAQDDDGRVIGCARLLPTTKPYLLAEAFPELLNGQDHPQSEDIWELSRFAAVDLGNKSRPPRGQLSSPIATELLKEAIACARRLGAKQLISVSPVGVNRLLKKCGLTSHRVGLPMVVNGYSLCACWIDVTPFAAVSGELK